MIKTDLLISVIVPIYNVEKYLERCLNSILNQNYKNIEVILVDDGSPDKCPQICDKYKKIDNRIRVIHKENGGLSSARNAGLEVAKGDYISFVDSDDWISKDMYTHSVALVDKYNADIVSVSYLLTNKDINIIKDEKEDILVFDRDDALFEFLDFGMKSRVSDYPVWNKIYKKSLFEEILFPIGKLYEDYSFNTKVIKKCHKYVRSSRKCYFYYQGGKSIVRNGFRLKDYDLIAQCKEVCELVSDENEKIVKIANDKLERSFFSLLLKISVYGFDNELSKEERKNILNDLIYNYKKSYKNLLKSNMPLNRKILLPVVYINYRLLFIARLINKLGAIR